MRVCVYCSASTAIDDSYVAVAHELGTALARRGHSLVSGGGSISSMGAVTSAVRAAGGHTLGVIPEVLLALEVGDHDSDELLVTRSMRDRKALMDENADAFVALAGGLGTLEELLEIWVGRVLQVHDKPVVVLDPHGLFAPLREQVELLVARGFARPEARDVVQWAASVEEALDLVESKISAEDVTHLAAPRAEGVIAEELVEGE